MSTFEKITIVHSKSTAGSGDRCRHRERGPIPPPPPLPPSHPRRPAASPPPPPRASSVRRKYYVIEPEELETARQLETPKKHHVRSVSSISLPFTSRKRMPSESKPPKQELVLVRRRFSIRRNQKSEPASRQQPSPPRYSSHFASQERPKGATTSPARQTSHHPREAQSKEPSRPRSIQMPIRIHRDNETSCLIPRIHEHRRQPEAISPDPSYAENKRLQHETERRQHAEIIAQETSEALARAQKELARRERERRQHAEHEARSRAEDLARAERVAQRETEYHRNPERIALLRAEEVARAEREQAQRERERCQRSEQAVRDTREDLTRVQREAENIRRQRDQVIERNSELELERRQRILEEKDRDLSKRPYYEQGQSEADERVDRELERAREQAERYAAETERLGRARTLGIPRLPRHPVTLHHMSNGPGSLDERGERFFNHAIQAENLRREDRNMPSSRRASSPRRDRGGGLRRRDQTVYDDDFTRRGRRWN